MSRARRGARDTLSLSEARRVALKAQGFLDPPHTPPTMRTLSRTLDRTGVLQIDSVNVLQRAQYMPLLSRMGPYDPDLLHRAAGTAPRRLVEYWAHAAAFMPVELWPVMRHRMRRYQARGHEWAAMRHRPELVHSLLTRVREEGPKTARDLDDGMLRRREHWGWNWSESKKVLEYLFLTGELAVAGRNAAFERVYDVPERVLPPTVLEQPEPTEAEAHVELVRRAAISHGVATERSLADYYRMGVAETRVAVRTLLESGELLPVAVEGWRRPAYLHRDARIPRRVEACALLSPFDPVVWERERAEALFAFRYRIEIYVPAPLRVHGYYVLPFLLGERLVARVDLKADRAAGALLVQGVHAEVAARDDTPEQLALALRELAGWLRLGRVSVAARGDLGRRLEQRLAVGL